MENNLNELNGILFDTLRGVRDGNISVQEALAITSVSNSIISNSRTQLQVFKLTGGKAYRNALQTNEGTNDKIELASDPSPKPGTYGEKEADTFEQKYDFAKEQGYKNVADAISAMGKFGFENAFKAWNV